MRYLCLSLGALSLAAATSAQSVPATINYQGRLTDNTPSQAPVNATVQMQFAIYDAATAGARLWQEPAADNTGTPVPVTAGIFNYVLGNTVAIPPTVFTGATSVRYLQITLNPAAGAEILSPRQLIGSSAYAQMAQKSNSADTAATATSAASFTSPLAGNVTGTQSATVVATVGGQTAANVAAGTALANAATDLNTAGALVRRDASGDFTAGTITAALNGQASSAYFANYLTANGANCAPGHYPLGVDQAGAVEGCSDAIASRVPFSLGALDTTGDTGKYTSITIGSDGLGLVSFTNGSSYMNVDHCVNAACSGATGTSLSAGIGWFTSVMTGSDSLGLISFYDGALRVAHCSNVACSSAVLSTLDNAGNVGWDTSLAIGGDGLGLVSYYDFTNKDLKVAHCTNTACTAADAVTVLDTTGDVGRYSSITVGTDGLGLISYRDETNGRLKVLHCANLTCSSVTPGAIEAAGAAGGYTSITIGNDGLGLISYQQNGVLRVAHCLDVSCSGAAFTTLDGAGFTGQYTSITIGQDGLGLISYYDVTNHDLKVAHCANAACSSASLATLDAAGDVGQYTSITTGGDGFGLISYYDFTNGNLKVAHCANALCNPNIRRR